MKALSFLVCFFLAGSAQAEDRPFVFTVTTSPFGSASDSDTRPWTAYYDSGYGQRTGEPFGYDGVEQRFGVQGRLGAGLTLLGHVGLGIGEDATRSSQQAELLKDMLGSTSSASPRRRRRGPTRVGRGECGARSGMPRLEQQEDRALRERAAREAV